MGSDLGRSSLFDLRIATGVLGTFLNLRLDIDFNLFKNVKNKLK